MKNYFLPSSLSNKPRVTIFILCSYLLQVQTKHDGNLTAVFKDLENIKTNCKIDSSFYTAEYTKECKESVMRCFFLEMKVIHYESQFENDKRFTRSVLNVLKNINPHISDRNYQNTETSNCQECETFEEKKCTAFLTKFEAVLKTFYKERIGRK